MAGTAAGLDDADVLWIDVPILDGVNLPLHLFCLLRVIHIILHLGTQRRIRITFQPDTADRVLCHIAHNPVRCKELGDRRKRILGDGLLGRKDLVLL